MKKDLEQIYERLLADAHEPDPKKRFYKMSDKDLLTHVDHYGEYFEPKQTRTLLRDGDGAPSKLSL